MTDIDNNINREEIERPLLIAIVISSIKYILLTWIQLDDLTGMDECAGHWSEAALPRIYP